MNEQIELIEVWTDECYSCHSKKYDAVMRFIIDNKVQLEKYKVRRIPLKREWIQKAKEYRAKNRIDGAFVVIKKTKGKDIVESVKNFKTKADEIAKNILTLPEKKENKRPAKKIAAKTANIKKNDEEVVEKAE